MVWWLTRKKDKKPFPVQKVAVQDANIDSNALTPSLGVLDSEDPNPTLGSLTFRRRAKSEQKLSKEEQLNIGELCHLSDDDLRDQFGITDPAQLDMIIAKMTPEEFEEHLKRIRRRREALKKIQEQEVAAGTA